MKNLTIAVLFCLLAGCTHNSGSTAVPNAPVKTYNLDGKVSLLLNLLIPQARADSSASSEKHLSDLAIGSLCSEDVAYRCAVLVRATSSGGQIPLEKDLVVVSIAKVDASTGEFHISLAQQLDAKEVYKILILKSGFSVDAVTGAVGSSREIVLLGSDANDAASEESHKVLQVSAEESLVAQGLLSALSQHLGDDLASLKAQAAAAHEQADNLMQALAQALHPRGDNSSSLSSLLDSLSGSDSLKKLAKDRISRELSKKDADQNAGDVSADLQVISASNALLISGDLNGDDITNDGVISPGSIKKLGKLSHDEKIQIVEKLISYSLILRKEWGRYAIDMTAKDQALTDAVVALFPAQTCAPSDPAVFCANQQAALNTCTTQAAGPYINLTSFVVPNKCLIQQMNLSMCQSQATIPVCEDAAPSDAFSKAQQSLSDLRAQGQENAVLYNGKLQVISNTISAIYISLEDESGTHGSDIIASNPEYQGPSLSILSPIFLQDVNVNRNYYVLINND